MIREPSSRTRRSTDRAVEVWVARAPIPTRRSGGSKAVVDGQVYVAGRCLAGGSAFDVSNPVRDRCEKLPDLPTQRNHLAKFALYGKKSLWAVASGHATAPSRPT